MWVCGSKCARVPVFEKACIDAVHEQAIFKKEISKERNK